MCTCAQWQTISVMMQWLQSLSQHCIRSHAPEITLTTFSCFPFYITVKHKFVHRTWKAAKGLIYTKPVLRKRCLPADPENKLKAIRMKGWKYRGRVKSWQYWLKQDVSNVSPLQEGWWCGIVHPTCPGTAACPETPLSARLPAQKPPCWPEPGSIHAQRASLLLAQAPWVRGSHELHFTHRHGLFVVLQHLWRCHLHSNILQRRKERNRALCVFISL